MSFPVSANSEKFPNIFKVADSNFIFGKFISYISLNQLPPNLLGNFSEFC